MKTLVLLYNISFFQGGGGRALVVFGDEWGDSVTMIVGDEFDFISGVIASHIVFDDCFNFYLLYLLCYYLSFNIIDCTCKKKLYWNQSCCSYYYILFSLIIRAVPMVISFFSDTDHSCCSYVYIIFFSRKLTVLKKILFLFFYHYFTWVHSTTSDH